ncbi:MAG: AAA family ATPase [Chroococcidiopsidaceae cyanobacterium CP_BM_RX_35]|nr:AAA family ATPase [Chroococcidiopsidaceae cyanobacterium CP_BM_RX_35]
MVRQIQQVTPAFPCLHCGKPDWCYRLGELTVCKRDAEPATGWEATSKRDAEGSCCYYAPIQPQKSIRPAQKRFWDYPARDGSPLIQVRREDYGDGRKAKIRPWRWTGFKWVEGYEGHLDRAEIPVYQLGEVKRTIASGLPVFIVEGEPCADALRSLGLVATTNIGGAKKWRESDSADLTGAQVILCPDRDVPGLEHMERIAQDFSDALWLYAFPDSLVWNHRPSSQGLDVADWIQEQGLTQEEILAAVGSKRLRAAVNPVEPPQKKKADWTFMDICSRIKEIQQFIDPGEREWEMQTLAKQTGRSVAQLYKVYDTARQNQPAFELTDGVQLLEQSPEKFDWLVAGLLPMATTALLYAEGGTGKTLLANSIIKAVACRQSWNGFPTKHGKVLLMQTDEPAVVTAQNLKIAQFQEFLQPGQLLINSRWQFTQTQQLREAITTHKPVLVVIDSLTSCNRMATVEEKDVEYGRCLYELRDIAMELGCTILVLHHENKSGGVRGSTAIQANVSEVWHLKRDGKLSPTQRLIEIEKSRSGCAGVYQLQLDVDDYSWQHQGDFDPSQAGIEGEHSRPLASLPLKARVLNFLEERPGIPFEVEELVGEFGGTPGAVRKVLTQLWRAGLIEFQERSKPAGKGTTKYKVYLFAELDQRSEAPSGQGFSADPSDCEAPIQDEWITASPEADWRSDPLPDKTLEAVIQTDTKTEPLSQSDFQSSLFPAAAVSPSQKSRLMPQHGVVPQVGDAVITPLGQGRVCLTYPNGQFGVELEDGRSFSAWSASEITVLPFEA